MYYHCASPQNHDYFNNSAIGSAMGGNLYGLGQASVANQLANLQYYQQGPSPEPKRKSEPASARRCIDRLREEIKDWHGSILKS